MMISAGLFAFAGLLATPTASAWIPHAPIVIVGNGDFTGANGVTGGSGTPADPYVIEGWEIDGSANSCIEVYSTDAHFVIRDVYLHSALIDAIYFFDVRNGRVENATVTGNDAGLYIEVSSNVTVASSNISFNTLDAIVLDWSQNVTVEGNQMWGNGDWGVFTYEADDLVVRGNTVANQGWVGIEFDFAERVTVEGNTVVNNNVAGLIVDFSSNVTVLDNAFLENGYNVDLTDSVDVLIRGNTVEGSSSDGITITGGTRLTIEENNITGNGVGVGAVGVTALLVRHNAFYGNVPQAADDAGGANAWDDGYPSGGNFWDDYAGVDDCSGPNQNVCPNPDGIGDTPYVIDPDTQDGYPLMAPGTTGSPGYTVTSIPPLPGDLYTIPWAVNETGAVVGWSTDGSVERPFLYTDAGGTMPLLFGVNRVRGTARDVDATGVAVGGLYGPDPEQAVRWPSPSSAPDLLGVLGPGPTSHAWGVNETGAVVGWSDYGGVSPHAFLYTDAAGMVDITPLSAARAYDISDSGRVVGSSTAGGAFRWSEGTLESLGVPAGFDTSRGQAINEAGQVAGCVSTVPLTSQRVARYTDGLGWEILGGGGDTNCAWGINAYGDAVGNGRPTGVGIVRAFLYTDAGGMQDLETLTNRTPDLRLLDATDINDIGQIVGFGWDNTVAQYLGYRLEPLVPPPVNRPPTATLVGPNGGEVWTSGGTHDIEWTMSDAEDGVLDVVAELSTDGGATFPYPLFSNAFVQGRNAYAATLPTVETTAARVRICTTDSDGSGACDVSDGNFTITATIVEITVETDPTGLQVRVDGTNRTAPFLLACLPSSTHSVEAPSPQANGSDTQHRFDAWSDGGAQAHDIPCDVNRTISATYLTDHRLVLDTSPAGLTVIADGVPLATPHQRWCVQGGWLDIGTASPQYLGADRYEFDRWSDGGARNHTIGCAAPENLTAFFLGPVVGPPSVTLLSPVGGEAWTGGSLHSIAWTMDDPDDPVLNVSVTLSVDGGLTFPFPVWSSPPLPIGPQSYPWSLPLLDTTTARVRVCVADSSAQQACDEGGDFAIDSTPPAVVSVSPRDGAANVDLTEPIVVTFSEPMDAAAFPVPGIALVPPLAVLLPGWSGGGLVLTEAHGGFTPCTTYAATVDSGGSDISDPGNALQTTFSWAFSTVCPPTVELFEPVGGEDWTGGSSHEVRFRVSDESDAQLLAWVNTTVGGVRTTLSSGLVPVGDTVIPWTLPLTTSNGDVTVTVVDSSGLEAQATSGSLGIDATAPALLSTDPANEATDVGVQITVWLTFSESMHRASVEQAILVTPAPPGPTFSWDAGGTSLAIQFDAPLEEYTDYLVAVGCGARDDSDPGNSIEGCPGSGPEVRFRTEIVTPPPVASVVTPTDVRAGVPVTFDGRGSTGAIETWTWTVASEGGGILATLDGPLVSYAFGEVGTYRVSLRVTDTFGRSDEYRLDVIVSSGTGPDDGNGWILAILTAGVVATILFAASEPGRVAMVTATAGRLYGRRRKDEKDSELRGAILYYVRVHPGDPYMDIKRNLDLNDGVVTYHLARLAKDGLITSAIRGARKRYYPTGIRVPLENGGELHEIQQRILRIVAGQPGMPVALLAEQLGVSYQLTLYHIRQLARADQVSLERRGLRLTARQAPKGPSRSGRAGGG